MSWVYEVLLSYFKCVLLLPEETRKEAIDVTYQAELLNGGFQSWHDTGLGINIRVRRSCNYACVHDLFCFVILCLSLAFPLCLHPRIRLQW